MALRYRKTYTKIQIVVKEKFYRLTIEKRIRSFAWYCIPKLIL